ncbi:C25 family cysteine peptidase [Candidatus Uabimicrobium sp. HlEnr_7]|uniref:C25 family cysteine peptidase n=1 Tax=Candidatus Uabimicrobium helgolandensis TaxID=3095367 RepID=UPI0035572666
MKKSIFLIFFALLFSLFTVAEEFIINPNVEKNQVVFVSEDFESETPTMTIRAQLRSGDYEIVETPKGKFARMIFPGAYSFNPRSPGEPQRPVHNAFIEAPLGSTVRAEVVSVVETEYTNDELGINYDVFPNQPSVCKQQKDFEFAYLEAAYKRGYAKFNLVSVREIGILRGFRLFMLQVKLCDYSPKDGKIKFYSDVEIKITFKDADIEKTKQFKKIYSSPPVDNVCRTLVQSPAMRSLQPERKGALKYLIVSDPMFRGEVQRFVDHKKARNITSTVLYTDKIGKTKEDIQDAIKKEYDNPKDGIVPAFLLLVGDKEQIPTFDGTEGYYVTDLYYAAVKGNDYLPDMLHGRFSAQNVEQLKNQIDKTIAYESGNLPDYGFLKKVVMTAGWDSYWAVKRGYPHIRYAKEYHVNSKQGYEGVEQNTFLSSGSQQNSDKIIAAVSRGVGLFNYTAHGTETDFHDPMFTINDVNKLTNFNQYTVVIGNCCLTNSFEVETCFGEAWLRTPNKGAVGFIGGSSYTYWDEDFWWGVGNSPITTDIDNGVAPKREDTGVGSYDSTFDKKNYFTNAGMMLAGNMAVLQADSYLTKYYFEVYHLMGDPGLQAYWATPSVPPSSK